MFLNTKYFENEKSETFRLFQSFAAANGVIFATECGRNYIGVRWRKPCGFESRLPGLPGRGVVEG